MNGILKIVAVSDIHFGQPKIVAEDMYNRLKRFLYPELKEAHLIFIAGDLYDQLLTVNSKAHRYAVKFVVDLLRISAYTGMQVRILHGTFTHDRDQLSIFETLNVPNARFRVINQIEVEEIENLKCGMEELPDKLRIGYIPDNLPYRRSEEAVAHLIRTMTVLGWTSLDMLVGHGTFEHAIDPASGHKPPCLFCWEQFKTLVQGGPIIMGHIHSSGRKRNVYYCGSFDRMAHGEEEKKGFYTFTKHPKDGWKSKFIQNELATPFISIQPKGEDVPEIIRDFQEKMDIKFPTRRGYVRVLHESPEVRAILHRISAQEFPDVIYSSKSIGEKEVSAITVNEITLDIFDDVKPDVHNLGALVYQYLDENNVLDGLTREVIIEKTNQLLGDVL